MIYLTAIFLPATLGGGVVTKRSLSHLLRIQVLMRLDQESCTLITAYTHTHTEGKKWKGRLGNGREKDKGRQEDKVKEEGKERERIGR